MTVLFQVKDTEPDKLPRIDVRLLGRRITCMPIESIIDEIYRSCSEDRQILVASYSIHTFNLTMQLPWLQEFQQSANFAIIDGMGLLIAMRQLGLELPNEYRVSYTLLMPRLLETCNKQGLSIFLLGGRPHVNLTALELLRLKYPRLQIDGHHGYFSLADEKQNEAVIEKINHSQPQVLVVGMGIPRQEEWVATYRHRLPVSALLSSGGAIIDRLAGLVPDCPLALSNMGLEWVYRLCREPQRLTKRYLLGNPAFFLQIALAQSMNCRDLLTIEDTRLVTQP